MFTEDFQMPRLPVFLMLAMPLVACRPPAPSAPMSPAFGPAPAPIQSVLPVDGLAGQTGRVVGVTDGDSLKVLMNGKQTAVRLEGDAGNAAGLQSSGKCPVEKSPQRFGLADGRERSFDLPTLWQLDDSCSEKAFRLGSGVAARVCRCPV